MDALAADQFVVPLAGDTVDLTNWSLSRGTPFVSSAPREAWGRRHAYWPSKTDPLMGVSDYHGLSKLLPEIEAGLQLIAGFLYGRDLFAALLSLTAADLADRTRTVLLRLHDDDNVVYYEYRPKSCEFALLQQIPHESFAGTVDIIAGDLIALLRDEVEPRAIVRGIREEWAVKMAPHAFFRALWMCFHPLNRRVGTYLQYKRKLSWCELGAARRVDCGADGQR
jgi:hypothetical protein